MNANKKVCRGKLLNRLIIRHRYLNIFINKEELPEFINFKLDLNGKIVQNGNTKDMLFPVDKLIEYISQFYTLKIGDLLFTGTPVGVGEVKIGDRLKGYLEDQLMFDFEIRS